MEVQLRFAIAVEALRRKTRGEIVASKGKFSVFNLPCTNPSDGHMVYYCTIGVSHVDMVCRKGKN